MDFWIIAAYLFVTLALGLFVGAGVGYYAAAQDRPEALAALRRKPRYRRLGRPE